MLYEILIRATAMLAEIESAQIAGSYYHVADDIPEGRQDFDGYSAWWGDPQFTQERINDTKNMATVTMPGYLQSPQIRLGNRFTTRTFMLQYMDLIKTKFIRRPRLMNSSGQMLNGIETSQLVAGRLTPVSYPDGQTELIYYQFTYSLVVVYTESNPC